jgi:hypothetical protein
MEGKKKLVDPHFYQQFHEFLTSKINEMAKIVSDDYQQVRKDE